MTETDPPAWTRLPDLASRAVGGSVVLANDESFAERENLIIPAAPEHRPHTFGHKGQVYDGWETRRRREPGQDHAVIRLGLPGRVHGVLVDTAFFTGNYPPFVSVEGCGLEGYPSPAELAEADWETVVPKSAAAGDHHNHYPARGDRRYTHIRLTLHPDGGVARLRVFGEPIADPRHLLLPGPVDLAALETGGQVVACSNMFYSAPANLLAPGQATVMGEGWETARRRDNGNDWVSVRLAAPGVPRLVELDTSHFTGNAPGWATLRGCAAPAAEEWFDLLPRTRLQPDTRHRFRLAGDRPVRQVRLDIFPDGGMARLRLFGELTRAGRVELVRRWFNHLPAAQAQAVLIAECAATADRAAQLVTARPLADHADLPAELTPLLGPDTTRAPR